MIGIILLHQKWNNGQSLVMLLIMYSMIGNLKEFYNIDVKIIDQKNHRKIYDRLREENRQVIELDFGNTQDKLKGEYLIMYEGVK